MITFIATAYKETIDIYQFTASLLLQTDDRWKCIIYCDGGNDYIEDIVAGTNDNRFSTKRVNPASGYWGHKNRRDSINQLPDNGFVIQTSVQDYYVPITVSSILKLENDFDLIYFNCIHNHLDYHILDTNLVVNHVDWGSFALRNSIAKAVGIDNVESSVCDGLFAEKCSRYNGIRIHKIDKILTVHN